MSRPRSLRTPTLLVWMAAVLAILAATACSNDPSADDGPVSLPDEGASPAPPDEAAPPGDGDETLAPDMVRIDGTIASGRADAATDGDVAGPFSVRVPSPGGGNGAVFNPVAVDGTTGSIVWDGGRPLTLEGPALHLDGAFTFDGGVVAFDLSSSSVALAPGSYRVVGPVAVGDPTGLARPADTVSFVAGPDSGILGTGTSSIVVAGPTTLLGPGSLDISGEFTVTTSNGSTTARSIHVAEGSFQIDVSSPGDGTVSISGLARGAGWA